MSDDMAELKEQSESDFMKSIEPVLEELEHVRLDKLAAYEGRKVIGKIVAVIGTPFTAIIDFMLFFGRWSSGDDDGAGLTIVFLGALYYWVRGPVREYIKAYKQKLLPRLAKNLGNLDYDFEGKLLVKGMDATKVIPKYNRHDVEDHFSGIYKGTKIEFSEMKLKYKSSGKNSSTRTVFKGIGVLIDVPKKFYGHTIMMPNQAKITEWFKEKSSGLDRANLVDPMFEDKYDVYTNDQVEARYLIHPVMIERFQDLASEFDGKKVRAAYYQGQLLLLIESDHNHFEPADIYVQATSPVSVNAMRHDLLKVLSVVDQLELIDEKAMALDKKSGVS